LNQVNKRVLESLILSGAFDSLEGNRQQNFIAIPQAVNQASKVNGDSKFQTLW
jgi:DNA polymerase-3 subunit alpha